MESQKAIDILKQAILLEKRGYAFYCKVAEDTRNPDIKNIFTIMANEEVLHVKFLSEQFLNYVKNNEYQKITLPDLANGAISSLVLSDDIKKKISVAGFEGAAISAAIDMEKRAVEIYSKQAGAATDPNEKELFTWLSGWENSHLKILSDLDNELKEKIWFDNQFWPF
jgi:rubrerythrin